MTKAVGYREFIEYIAYNDDVSEIYDEELIPTVLMSACSHLFNKPIEEVMKAIRNKVNKIEKGEA